MKKTLAILLVLVLALGVLAGCGGAKDNDGEKTLIWYARINKEPDSAEVFQKVSDMAKEKIGVAVDIIALEDYHGKMPVIQASGEDYDIVYTSSVINNIYNNVNDGNLLPLDDLLKDSAPKLWEMFGEEIWDGVRIGGKIYGVPNQQIFARGPGYMIPTQNIKALGLDLENTKYETLEDYESYFRAIKEKTGSYGYLPSTWGGDGPQLYGFEQVIGSEIPGVIRFADDSLEVINQYETQEFIDHINLRTRWVKEGLISPMKVTIDDVTKYLTPEDQVMPWLIFQNTCAPGAEAIFKKNNNLDVTFATKSEGLVSSYSLVSTMAAINLDSRYPVEAIKFIELLNTDPEIYNTLVYGFEGKHYTKTGENTIELSKENSYTQPAWAIGNTFNAYILPGQDLDVHEQTKAVNDAARRSPILGFAPDQEPIKVEVANCRAVVEEYADLTDGIMDTETAYPAFIEKLKAAGCDKIITELNKQIQAWKASK